MKPKNLCPCIHLFISKSVYISWRREGQILDAKTQRTRIQSITGYFQQWKRWCTSIWIMAGIDATSREGSRIALKLETKGLILREKELFKGRWTYRLFPKRKPASLNSIIDSPCLMCPNDARCGAWSPISPNECPRLTAWILGIDQPETESSGEI